MVFEASVEGGYIEVVEYILQHNPKLERASTVVNSSVKNKDQDMVELLLNYGFLADVQDSRKKAPMAYAYEHYDLNMCKFLLSKGVNIDSKIHRSYTLLHVAVAIKPNEEFIKHLLKQGANIDAITESNSTSLHIACGKRYEDIVELLLKNNADIHVKDKDGYTALHKAIRADDANIAGKLLDRGSDINATTNSLLTPLHLAVAHSRGTMVHKLLNCPDVDLNAKDSTKKTALHHAVINRSTYDNILTFLNQNRDLEDINNKLAFCLAIIGNDSKYIVNIFLNWGFIIEAKDFLKFETPEPLHSKLEAYSVQEKFMRVSQDLLRSKATTKVLFRYKVLQASVKNGYVEIVRQLLKENMNLNALLDNGRTLLHDAIVSSQFLVAEELLKHGASVNALDERKRTPLHISILLNSKKHVAFLLKRKADLEAPNEDGETALHLSVRGGNSTTAFILEAGANVNSANNKGDTALHLAAKGRHEHIVQLLLDHDAEIHIGNEEKETPLHVAENDPWYGNSKSIIEHAIKIQVANSNDTKVEVPPHMDDFCKICEDEVKRMKCDEIGRNISMFDIFNKRENKVAAFMRNENIVQIINTKLHEEMFPLYSSMLKIRINTGKTRNELLERGATCFESIFETLELKIPVLIIQEFFSYLSSRDLRNLIYSTSIEIGGNSSDSSDDSDLSLSDLY